MGQVRYDDDQGSVCVTWVSVFIDCVNGSSSEVSTLLKHMRPSKMYIVRDCLFNMPRNCLEIPWSPDGRNSAINQH